MNNFQLFFPFAQRKSRKFDPNSFSGDVAQRKKNIVISSNAVLDEVFALDKSGNSILQYWLADNVVYAPRSLGHNGFGYEKLRH